MAKDSDYKHSRIEGLHHPKRSKVARASDALANTLEDKYPEGSRYESGVSGGPANKPGSVSKHSRRSQ